VNSHPTTTGTIADVAAFFRVSVRTVAEWKAERPPRLAFWQEGRNVCFGEEAVIDLRARMTMSEGRRSLDEARETARREWREHLAVRRPESDLLKRVLRLEQLLQNQRTDLAA
jgi:hypothetical protein